MSCRVHRKQGNVTYVVASRSFWNKARKRTECVTAHLGFLGGDGKEYVFEEVRQGYVGVEPGQYTSVRRCRKDKQEHPEWFENGGRGRGNVKAPNAPDDEDDESSDGATHGMPSPLHPPPMEEESRAPPCAFPASGEGQGASACAPPCAGGGGAITPPHAAEDFGSQFFVTALMEKIQRVGQRGTHGCATYGMKLTPDSVISLEFLDPYSGFSGRMQAEGIHPLIGLRDSRQPPVSKLAFLSACANANKVHKIFSPRDIMPEFASNHDAELWFTGRLNICRGSLNERTRRYFAALDAETFGHEYIPILQSVYKIGRSTIYRGIREINEIIKTTEVIPKSVYERIRREGGGRKQIQQIYPKICEHIEEYVSADARGDPESPLLYASSSVRNVDEFLMSRHGIQVSPTTVFRLLKLLGYSLQSIAKVKEGTEYPYRDAQFQLINSVIKSCRKHRIPIISVDTKNKFYVGEYWTKGQTWCVIGHPTAALDHDFPSDAVGRAVPYGIYDILANKGYVWIGKSYDTAEFAVNSILAWWDKYGKIMYPNAKKLVITCDCGGSNGYRVRLWKLMLHSFTKATGINVQVMHYPPGSSKWNKIEHNLFSFLSKSTSGRLLPTYGDIINYYSATRTEQGLSVVAELDERDYEKGIKIEDSVMDEIDIIHFKQQPELNYIIRSPKNRKAA